MVALTNYEEHVNTVVKEGVDFIISGAGLPLKLPVLTEGAGIKLIPIVSSARAADIIIKTWKKRYNLLTDAIVVEGPLSGGHLGFKFDELTSNKYESLEKIVRDVVKLTKQYKEPPNNIPVIAAGGILTGKDIAKFLKLGASGVQIATPFVVTHECSVPDSYKQLYLSAKKEDIVIIESPVKMPGRTKFIDRITNGKRIPYRCAYKCIKTCDPKTAQYCICEALYNAVKGDLDNAIVFCGTDVTKLHKIVSVKELLDNLIKEAERELYR